MNIMPRPIRDESPARQLRSEPTPVEDGAAVQMVRASLEAAETYFRDELDRPGGSDSVRRDFALFLENEAEEDSRHRPPAAQCGVAAQWFGGEDGVDEYLVLRPVPLRQVWFRTSCPRNCSETPPPICETFHPPSRVGFHIRGEVSNLKPNISPLPPAAGPRRCDLRCLTSACAAVGGGRSCSASRRCSARWRRALSSGRMARSRRSRPADSMLR
eukprot:SAG11_NODE_433_length_9518_cov_11.247054_2_plen_215_part_00